MDNKTFMAKLSEMAGGKASVADKTQALIEVIRQICTDLDTVAIPAFGSFTGVKHDEYESEKDGERTLMPPKIDVEFRPSVILRKRIQLSGHE